MGEARGILFCGGEIGEICKKVPRHCQFVLLIRIVWK
jgi:hypothetical protein